MYSFLNLEVLQLACASGQRNDEVKGGGGSLLKTELGTNGTVDVLCLLKSTWQNVVDIWRPAQYTSVYVHLLFEEVGECSFIECI